MSIKLIELTREHALLSIKYLSLVRMKVVEI